MIEPLRKTEITTEVINSFINGTDPMERIVNLEYKYDSDKIKVYYRNENDIKCYKMENFYPFVWATRHACTKLCDGDRSMVSSLMRKYGIGIRTLDTRDNDGKVVKNIEENGYIFMFYAKRPMSYQKFLKFFKEANNPIYSKSKDDGDDDEMTTKEDSRQYLIVTPQEQYMISSGRRFFKGYEDYDEVLRMIFDLETEGLDPRYCRINQFGIRFNRPVRYKGNLVDFERILTVTGNTKEEKDANELHNIKVFLSMIQYFNPDVITAHNGENFDWNFIIERCKMLGTTIEDICANENMFDGEVIRKNNKESVLKLGGEVESFYQTIVPGIVITDSLHAVRRAQAIDSNMLRADLKYVTKYSKMEKSNRVYVPGDKISDTWNDWVNDYALNNENGKWYQITEYKPLEDGYEKVTGKYIVERYLLDDLWECDKVEHRYNTPNFMICKMLPVPYQKCCTMGTAGQWKALLMAWSYENGLAIPQFGEGGTFTGGLSRLLEVGFVDDVAKFDYNSLYPSIILTWGISDEKDLMGATLKFLEYVLTEREKYKDLKKKAGKTAAKILERLQNRDYKDKEEGKKLNEELKYWKAEESANDKKQLPLKILGNSFFGSYGAENLFPWGSKVCAERTTCSGRMMLRLMIYYFYRGIPKKVGNDMTYSYKPVVGDSFTPDTPLFIRYKESGKIDIRPVEQLINPREIKIDALGREYDYSEKPFEVLCRSGWMSPEYIYRHKCDKDIYEISEGDMRVEVTEDHSLFNSDKVKIKPSEINENTKLEYYTDEIKGVEGNNWFYNYAKIGEAVAYHPELNHHVIPIGVYNTTKENMRLFYDSFMKNYKEDVKYSKTIIAGLQYIRKMIS